VHPDARRGHSERGTRGAHRGGQDDAGRGAARVRGGDHPAWPGGGREHRQRLRGDRAPARPLGQPGRRAGAGRRREGEPARRPGLRGLRRGPARRAAGGGRGAFRGFGGGRGGRLDPAALGGVRGGGPAARGRGDQAGRGQGGLRRDGADLPARLRRGGGAALPAAARRRGAGGRPDRAAQPADLRLQRRLAGGRRGGAGASGADRARAQRADRGDHRGERGRDADGPVPRRRGDRRQGADRRPGDGRRARALLPGDPGLRAHRGGHPRAARTRHAGLPGPRRAPDPRRDHAGRGAQGAARLRPGGTAGGRGGQDDLGPVRRPDLAGPGLLRHAAPRPAGARLRPRHGRARAPGPRRGRAGGRPVQPARQDAARGGVRGGRRPGGGRQAGARGDRRHALGEGRSGADGAVDHAGPAAAGGRRGAGQVGRGQAGAGTGPAGRGGPDAQAGDQPGDAPARALVPRRGTGCRCARPSPPRRGAGAGT